MMLFFRFDLVLKVFAFIIAGNKKAPATGVGTNKLEARTGAERDKA